MNTLIKNRAICFCICLISLSSHGQSLWPFRDVNNGVLRGNITGTVSDFRTNGAGVRFHAGVDVVCDRAEEGSE